jgi:L-amino acid N-acyltransferase YncA
MGGETAGLSPGVRPLQVTDLERMIRIDQAHTGQARRRFFEKRFAAAQRQPADFIHVGIDVAGVLAGFALARILHGEFGRKESVVVLDVLGVEPGSGEHGCGHALAAALLTLAQRQGVRQLQSQAEWTNHGLLKFFASLGFELDSRLVLERVVREPFAESAEEM